MRRLDRELHLSCSSARLGRRRKHSTPRVAERLDVPVAWRLRRGADRKGVTVRRWLENEIKDFGILIAGLLAVLYFARHSDVLAPLFVGRDHDHYHHVALALGAARLLDAVVLGGLGDRAAASLMSASSVELGLAALALRVEGQCVDDAGWRFSDSLDCQGFMSEVSAMRAPRF